MRHKFFGFKQPRGHTQREEKYWREFVRVCLKIPFPSFERQASSSRQLQVQDPRIGHPSQLQEKHGLADPATPNRHTADARGSCNRFDCELSQTPAGPACTNTRPPFARARRQRLRGGSRAGDVEPRHFNLPNSHMESLDGPGLGWAALLRLIRYSGGGPAARDLCDANTSAPEFSGKVDPRYKHGQIHQVDCAHQRGHAIQDGPIPSS